MLKTPMLCLLFTAIILVGCSPATPPVDRSTVDDLSAPDPDARIIVSLTPEQRLHVLGEMNQFLLSTQEIIDGVASKDRELIQSAVSDGLGRGQGPGLMKGALPPEFKQMGSAMKQELKKIDVLSKDGADDAAILDQLSTTLMHCQSCHVTYQIRLTEKP
jgi:hypothetical protein